MKDIIKLFYFVKYYDKQARSLLLNAGANAIIRLTDDKSTVQFENKSQLAMTWKSMYDAANADLKNRAFLFKKNRCIAKSTFAIPAINGINGWYGGGYLPYPFLYN